MLPGFHTAGLLILILSLQSQSEVISPFQIVEAWIGDDVILHCYLGPVSDVSNMTVEWTRADLDPRFIHVWPERPDLQNPAYKGRTSLFTDEMKDGYMWLKISPVKWSDEGMYTCFSPELEKNFTVQLIVDGKDFPTYELSVNVGIIGPVIGSVALCLILAVAFIVWKRTQGKFRNEPNQSRKTVIHSLDQQKTLQTKVTDLEGRSCRTNVRIWN
ncbi:myelin-oligodendrocyte glycoprotein-like isoform X2 [Oreochromis aureus]|uniref:myelin-oligodendrocyte glycoprotein-like isoform X2 n=1 Tax=Oreochromis aureus TaxID=47969 RepID=UPI001953B15B|nr:myelin-oligodendrocyte glycoprotein-like isoform X2 [Oreochromis aureus]